MLGELLRSKQKGDRCKYWMEPRKEEPPDTNDYIQLYHSYGSTSTVRMEQKENGDIFYLDASGDVVRIETNMYGR